MNPVELLQADAKACKKCHAQALLYAEGETAACPIVQKDPPWPVRVMAVMEAPNFDDSFDPRKGRLTVDSDTDPTGTFARELLASVGLRAEEVLFTNSVLCLPKQNGEGKHLVGVRQQDLCAEWLRRFIEGANPEVVITFGGVALQALHRLEPHGLTLRTGAGKLHAWRRRHLLPLYHPGRRGRVNRSATKQMEDISVLRACLGEPGAGRVAVRSGRGARLQAVRTLAPDLVDGTPNDGRTPAQGKGRS